jgi:hypothetical protein
MKNKLFRIILSAAFVAGLMLTVPSLLASPADDQPVVHAPMPSLGSFNDFEEMHWKGEVEAVLKKASDLESQGHNKIIVYEPMALINLAFSGNAYAAAYLSEESAFGIYPGAINEISGVGESPLGSMEIWGAYATGLTSPGWADYVADIRTGTALNRSRNGSHPAGLYWYARFNKFGVAFEKVFQSAYAGYAYAQADLAASYAKPGIWVWDPVPDRIERMLALEKASAEQGEPYGLYATGHSYYSGLHGERDPETALMYFRIAYLAIERNLRPGALTYSVLRDDNEFMYGLREAVQSIKPSKEMLDRAEARADEWLAGFMKKRESAYAPVRKRRARLVADMREKYRDEYIRVYGILKAEGIDLPPSIFGAGGL